MPDQPHPRFRAGATAYVQYLTDHGRKVEHFAVWDCPEFSEKPQIDITQGDDPYPLAVVTTYVTDRREIAEKIARILNAHWEELAEQPQPPKPAPPTLPISWRQEHALEVMYLGEIPVGRVNPGDNGWIFNLAGFTAFWHREKSVALARGNLSAALFDWARRAGLLPAEDQP